MAKNPKKQKEEQPTIQDDLEAALLLKDADEALRQERMESLWREWGSTVIGVALMIVFGTMLGVGWQSWRTGVHQTQTAHLVNAQQAGENINTSELSGHYAGIAALMAANDVANADNTQDTAKMIHNYMVDADESGLPRQYDMLAKWGVLRTKADIEGKADVKIQAADDMMDLADKRGNPYAALNMVEAAVLYGNHGNPGKAVNILNDVMGMDVANNNESLMGLAGSLKRLYETDIILSTKDETNE